MIYIVECSIGYFSKGTTIWCLRSGTGNILEIIKMHLSLHYLFMCNTQIFWDLNSDIFFTTNCWKSIFFPFWWILFMWFWTLNIIIFYISKNVHTFFNITLFLNRPYTYSRYREVHIKWVFTIFSRALKGMNFHRKLTVYIDREKLKHKHC